MRSVETVSEASVPISAKRRRIRYYIFLKDVLKIAVSAFGGPQVHMAMLLDLMVSKRGYLTEEELLELNALCQILPGPTSTQTITAIGFRMGGPNLAYLALLVWITPAVLIMTAAALSVIYFEANHISISFTRYIQPMAVAFVAFSGYKISRKVIRGQGALWLMLFSTIASYYFRSPWACPIILLISGGFTALNFKEHQQEKKESMKIQWANFILFISVAFGAAILGGITRSVPMLLFENFYRNGSLIFGGGQVLTPLLFTEFVHFKHYLTSEEFLSGLGLAQVVPGPVFSFTAYIGTLSMRKFGLEGQLLGSFVATAGIFLPGTFMIFFVIRFWDQLKRYRVIKASLNGINAASTGLIASAAILLFEPMATDWLNILIVLGTFVLLQFNRIAPPLIFLGGLLLGFLI